MGVAATLLIAGGWRRLRRHVDVGAGSPWVPTLKRVLVWFVAAILTVVTAGFAWLAWLALDWIRQQQDWVKQVAGFGPLATACAAAVALLVGWATIAQKRRSDRRDQWWKRAQWALDLATTADGQKEAPLRRKVGQSAIAYLGRESELSTLDDLQFLQAAYPAALVQDVQERLEQSGIEDADLDVEVVEDANGE